VAFQRRYVSYIKRCDELERKLRYIKGELTKFGLDTEVRTASRKAVQSPAQQME
jgi:V-type H+-transporting ATPase subunit a